VSKIVDIQIIGRSKFTFYPWAPWINQQTVCLFGITSSQLPPCTYRRVRVSCFKIQVIRYIWIDRIS